MKELEFTQKLTKIKDNMYEFSRIFRSEMSYDEIMKIVTNSKNNIIVINKELENHTSERKQLAIKKMLADIDIEIANKTAALKDFNTYMMRTITVFKNKAEATRKEFKEFIKSAPEIKKQIALQFESTAKTEKEDLLFQLKDEEDVVEVYKDVKEKS